MKEVYRSSSHPVTHGFDLPCRKNVLYCHLIFEEFVDYIAGTKVKHCRFELHLVNIELYTSERKGRVMSFYKEQCDTHDATEICREIAALLDGSPELTLEDAIKLVKL